MNDLISRQAAIDICRKARDKSEAHRMLVQLPSAQQWIPCSERLPEVRQQVLCQCRVGIRDVLRLTEDGDWEKLYPRTQYFSSFVLAWMPLPAPWEGGQNG